MTFTVDTTPPEVSMNPVASPTNDATPTLGGAAGTAAGDNTTVAVTIYEGKAVGGKVAASGNVPVSVGAWSYTSSHLGDGIYTAQATQGDTAGNTGTSEPPVTFTVDTTPPEVSMNPVASPTNDATPTLGGAAGTAAGDNTTVAVTIYEGKAVGGKVAASGNVPVSVGAWSYTSSHLGDGIYTAQATQKDTAGNTGTSAARTFTVDTQPPTVTLSALSPARSNVTRPSFSGTASEETEVEVHVLEGSTTVATATVKAEHGTWSTSGATLSKALPEGNHAFTAYATEKSALTGNPEGKSETRSFEVDTKAPTVTLTGPSAPSNHTTPGFSGTASEATEVVVHVLLEGTEVASATTTAAGGKWSTKTLSEALVTGKHTFTAYATEVSGLGNTEGKSATVSFEVNTESPSVTLESPALVSSNTTPSFSGTANESLPVTVEVFKGPKAEVGTPVATLVAPVAGGRWSSAHLTTPLENGQYTAIASEPSSLENRPGHSESATFEVNTQAPTVTLNSPPSPSNDTTPSFSGTISGSAGEAVTVYVYEGTTFYGRIVRTVTAPVKNGNWSSGPLTALPDGKQAYTAVASAPSAIGNATGKSRPVTFVLDTEPPTVTLTQPTPLSNIATPSFSGTASETAEVVVVSVYAGAKAEGSPIATAQATVTEGAWVSAALTQRLEDGPYTAIATQKSSIGNAAGSSSPVSFTIDTKPPAVTLNAVPSPSGNRAPSFSGTASDQTAITVDIYKGASTTGAVVASVTAEGDGGEWVSGKVATLEWGEYTAVATQPSSIGNPPGRSSPVTFAAEQIAPGVVTEATSEVTRTSAALYASVNPVGGPVSACYFEYGTTPSYGQSVECGFVSGSSAFPPAVVGFVPVFARIYGLHPSTTYHVRIVAVGEGGTGNGADVSFTTPAALSFKARATPPPAPSGAATGLASGGVAGLFAAQLKPTGKTARIGALLKNGLFKQRFKAPEAGTAVIKWYYLAPGAKLAGSKHAKKAAPSPVLVAGGSVRFHAAGMAAVKLRLTPAGRRLLRHSRRIRLTATCAFTPVGGAAVATSGTFQLSR